MTRPLAGQVALVAGATRGAGRAIALELALAGATVYATGRSSRQRQAAEGGARDPFDLARRPETIEETAERIEMAGGTAIGLCVDHSREAEVRALVARIEREQGRLDILINDIWGGDQLCEWGKPLWELELARGFQLLERALYTHLITSRHALPLMLKRQAGLLVEVTDGIDLYYRSNVFYDLAKFSVTRLAFACAEELHDKNICAVAISPGFLRSEAMLEHFGVSEATWREGIQQDEHFAYSETPRYVARGIAALAADPGLAAHSGKCYGSWQLQGMYGFADEDGSKPNWGEHAAACEFGKEQAAGAERFRAMFG